MSIILYICIISAKNKSQNPMSVHLPYKSQSSWLCFLLGPRDIILFQGDRLIETHLENPWIQTQHIIWLVPLAQDNSRHQDYEPLLV